MRKKVYDKIKEKFYDVSPLYSLLIGVLILVVGFIAIFFNEIISIWNSIINDYVQWFVSSFFYALFSKIPNNSIIIGIWILIISLFFCYWFYRKLKCRVKIKSSFCRYIVEFIFILFTIGVQNNEAHKIIFYFINSHYPVISYVYEIWFFIILTELILIIVYLWHNRLILRSKFKKVFKDIPVFVSLIRYIHNHHNNKIDNNLVYSYIVDSPTRKDDFNRSGYATVLLKKIFVTFDQELSKQSNKDQNGAFVINISENYGYGKSSFLLLLKDQAKKYTDKDQMILFEYKPWLCDSPQKIIGEFFKLLNENLSGYIPHIGKTINKYVRQLSEYYSSKNALAYMISNFFMEQSSISKEREQLKSDLECIGMPIVVLIDDVDRLRDEELMTLFGLLRNTADFHNIYYILAADMDYVKQVLKIEGIENRESYIKKFINFEFLLPGFDAGIMSQEFTKIIRDILWHVKDNFARDNQTFVEDTENSIEHIFALLPWNNIFTNIRDMKRFFNDYTMAIDCYISNNKKHDGKLSEDIDLANLFAIELLKYLNEPIYKVLRDHDDLIFKNAENNINQYHLKDDITFIIEQTYKDKDMEASVKRILDKKNQEKNESTNNQTPKFDNIDNVLNNNKIESSKNLINNILSHLFPNDSPKEENNICYRETYFRYFSYRFKNNQMSSSEVRFIMLKLNKNGYKAELDKVFSEKKQESFWHHFRFIENNDSSSDALIIEKLFLFVDKVYPIYPFSKYDYNKSYYEKQELVFKHYGIFDILFYWYKKKNYEGDNSNIKKLKKDISNLIMTDEKHNLFCLFLKNMYEKNSNLIFDRSDVLYWCGLLLNRILIKGKESYFNDAIKDISEILKGSFSDKSNTFCWLVFFVIMKDNHFICNKEYIGCLYKDKNDAINGLEGINNIDTNSINDNSSIEGIKDVGEMKKDLLELLNMDDISKETIDKHPFLQYARYVKEKYQITKA
jgi:hypothetical protein